MKELEKKLPKIVAKIPDPIPQPGDPDYHEPEKPDEFRAKPAWQRLIILLGGIIMNILVAFIIYSSIAFFWGDKYLPAENAKYGIYADEIALEMGLKNGDKVVSVDGKKPETFNEIPMMVILDAAKTMQVDRGGEIIDIEVPSNLVKKLLDNKGAGFISLAYPCQVGGFTENSTFELAGGQVGDNVVSLNGTPVSSFQEFVSVKGDLKSTTAAIEVERAGENILLNVDINEKGLLGFFIPPMADLFDLETKKYGFFGALVQGPVRTWSTFSGYFKQLKFLFNKENEGWKHVGSFGTFAKIFPTTFNLQMFLERTAFISVILAFMNLLPIPALDGGHAMFTTYEMIFRRKPNEKFMEYAQMAGMILLLGLMSLGIFNDIFR
jgi:regulator of sigma E protease